MRTLVCSTSTALYSVRMCHWGVGFRSALIRYSGDSGSLDDLDDEAADLSDAPQKSKNEIKANAENWSIKTP